MISYELSWFLNLFVGISLLSLGITLYIVQNVFMNYPRTENCYRKRTKLLALLVMVLGVCSALLTFRVHYLTTQKITALEDTITKSAVDNMNTGTITHTHLSDKFKRQLCKEK